MGVKYFFRYLKEKHSSYIQELRGRRLTTSIDALLLDMNGIFHPEAQKVFFTEKLPSLLASLPEKTTEQKELEMFQGVCKTIDKYISIVSPTKYVVLCVDGTAPLSKQNQQRQRRFRSKSEAKENSFDRNCLTPATEFMDKLTKHVHFHLKKLSLQNKQLSFVLSNEKVAGEGEQKLMAFVRKNPSLSYCVVGLDADLIFLGLSCPAEKFYILREDQYNPHNDFLVLNVGGLRESLLSELKRPSAKSISLVRRKYYINDFVFMCFAVGNDFLPHVPAIEILENGMEILFEVYQQTLHEEDIESDESDSMSPLTTKDLKFNKSTLKKFYSIVSKKEQAIFNEKYDHKDSYFPDPLLSSCYDGTKIDISLYSSKYYEKHFPNINVKIICHEYLKGLFWIITYYLKKVPSWTWRFPYQYAPFAHDLFLHIDSFQFEEFPQTVPTLPFIQLLSVLPKSSASLLPSPLSSIIQEEKSLQRFFPETLEIDLAGKKQDWEGIVILPQVDYHVVENIYFEYEDEISEEHRKRNRFGNSYLYSGSEMKILNFTDV